MSCSQSPEVLAESPSNSLGVREGAPPAVTAELAAVEEREGATLSPWSAWDRDEGGWRCGLSARRAPTGGLGVAAGKQGVRVRAGLECGCVVGD